jgi:hypothetical protein
MVTARHRRDKHMSMTTNEHATVEEPLEAVTSTQFMLRLYNKDQLDNLLSPQCVGGQIQCLAVWSCTVSSPYLATTSEQTEDFICVMVIVILECVISETVRVNCSHEL